MKHLKYLLIGFLLIGCATDLNPKPKFNHISGDNEGIICLKRSTKHELIYDIIPKDTSKSYYVHKYERGSSFYIYSLVKDGNRSAMPWDTLIPGVPNTLYIANENSVSIYWGDEYLGSFGAKDKACFRKDGTSVNRLNKEHYQDRLKENIMDSLVQSFYENLLSLP